LPDTTRIDQHQPGPYWNPDLEFDPAEAFDGRVFEPGTTTIILLPPKRMRAVERWYEAVALALAYKRSRPLLYAWLERAQMRLGAYGPDGAARKRDRKEFEIEFGEFGHGAAVGSAGSVGSSGA